MEKKQNNHYISPTQLRVGLYVHLDVGWMDHPFTFSNFKIQDAEQIEKIKAIGLKKLRFDPKRSDVAPLSLTPEQAPVATPAPQPQAAEPKVEEKPKPTDVKTARLVQLHQSIEENKEKFNAAKNITKQATEQFIENPEASIAMANEVVTDIVGVALTESDIAIHAMSQQDESDYQHNLNTMVLSLMLSKTLDLSKDDAHTLGVAALFHDIGKLKIQPEILTKTTLTDAEQEMYRAHTVIGAQLALDAGLSERTADIILSHHELTDGSGYPKQLNGDNIDMLARVVSLVNAYDNLCNPLDINQAQTPYEALAHLFAHQRHQYDEVILKRMIKTLGIYPPGSMVQLSTGMYANVISGNVSHPLRPFVMLHETNKANGEPTIIDLREEPTMNISICLRPNQLPPEVLDFFNPSKRMQFFLDKALPEFFGDTSVSLNAAQTQQG